MVHAQTGMCEALKSSRSPLPLPSFLQASPALCSARSQARSAAEYHEMPLRFRLRGLLQTGTPFLVAHSVDLNALYRAARRVLLPNMSNTPSPNQSRSGT